MMIKNIVISLSYLFAAITFFHGDESFALTPGEIRNKYKDAVVYLHISGAGQNGVPYEVDATGFIVSSTGDIISANHIFYDSNGQRLDHLTIIGWPGSRYDNKREIEIVETSSNLDLSLLKFKGSSKNYQTVNICNDVQITDGDNLVAIGFPKGSELSVINGILSNTAAFKGLYQTNVDFIQGYSGGPVFSQESGSVVGIVMGGTQDVAGRNFFLPIFRATGLLSLLETKPPCSNGAGKKIEIFDGNLDYGQSGFSYAHKEVVAWNSPDGDLLVATADRTRDRLVRFFMPYDEPPYNSSQDKAARSGIKPVSDSFFASETRCDSSGYGYHWRTATLGNAYCVRLRNGRDFIKIRVESLSKDSMVIEWK